jgi:hypothetical protein
MQEVTKIIRMTLTTFEGGRVCVGSGMGRALNLLMSDRDDALYSGGHKKMSSILTDQTRSCIRAQMRGEGCPLSANKYRCAHGAQINFGDLTSMTELLNNCL